MKAYSMSINDAAKHKYWCSMIPLWVVMTDDSEWNQLDFLFRGFSMHLIDYCDWRQLQWIMQPTIFIFFCSCCTISRMNCERTSPCTWTKTSCSCLFSSTLAEDVCAPSPCTSRPPFVHQENIFYATETPYKLTILSAQVPWRSWKMAWCKPFWVSMNHLRPINHWLA